jgi:hypothetical protein
MKFTPGQVQETLQLSPATFRHWKSALAPLGGRKGYTPCFSPGDLLAMAVIKSLTEDVGIRVGSLHGIAEALFTNCRRASWARLERSVLVIEPTHSRLKSIPETQPPLLDGLAILLPLRPIIRMLQDRLLLGHEEPPQGPLRFPPTAVTGKGRMGDAS